MIPLWSMEFFTDMEKEGGPKNTYVGELYFSAHRGTYTSQAMIKQKNRRGELALRDHFLIKMSIISVNYFLLAPI